MHMRMQIKRKYVFQIFLTYLGYLYIHMDRHIWTCLLNKNFILAFKHY